MVDYKKYIKLLKDNYCDDCMFMKYQYSGRIYEKYIDKRYTSCLSSVGCFCETELKMTEEQIIKYILKDLKFCDRDLVISRIIDFIEKIKLKGITKLEIE